MGGAQPHPPQAPSQGRESEGGEGGNPLLALSRLPQFNMLRRHIQSNPQMLQPLLQQIGQANPELLQVHVVVTCNVYIIINIDNNSKSTAVY